MFAFIDESGNTGPNLFDPDQPVFYSVAVISKRDLDIDYAPEFSRLAQSCGASSLHAAELGIAALERILPEIQRMIKRDNVRFFLGEITKRDLVLTKLADTLLDAHENRAVPWHVYNVRALRLLNVVKLSVVANEPSLKGFWCALMDKNPSHAQQAFVRCLQDMQTRLHEIPDARSRQIIGDAIQWAIAQPEAISVHSQRSARLGHLPHLVVFPSVLDAIQRQSEYWHRPVEEIRHDQESLVATALKNLHMLISNAPVTKFEWIDMTIPVGGAPGSKFKIVCSRQSAGVQLADIVLWLLRREKEHGKIGQAGKDFLKRVRRNGEPFELSLRGMEASLEVELMPIMSMPMPQSQLDEGKRVLVEIEQKRKAAMMDFENERAKAAPRPQ